MAENKNYKTFTGLKQFYYGVLNETDETTIEGTEAERVKFLQNISVEVPQEIAKAYGDNEVAEMAVSTDAINLTTTFHVIPVEDRATLYGWKSDDDGDYYLPSNPVPPYVACMFGRTSEDGGTEWLGFPKGIFTIPTTEGQTKQNTVEFGSDETQGQFMQREVEGIEESVPMLIKKDAPGETTKRDKMYQQLFGIPHPDADSTPEGA